VSRAHDHDLGRDIAIKELISRGHVSEVRFLREALITARLEHPGIVPVYEAGRWPDGTPFYAMKLVAGRSLRDQIAERTTVEQRIGLLHHVIAVADAIAYAHGRGIIHRDLKPANIIVGEFGETIVIDWGLAKDLTAAEPPPVDGGPLRADRDDGLTSTGTVLGTPAYMAPEQARGEQVDQRADVFAIGAMLWQLCGLQKMPPREPQLRRRMLRRAGIDRDLITIIDKAIAPDPAQRYPDAGALAADLKAFKSGARIAARSYSLLATLAHWIRRHRALARSVAAASMLAAAGGLLYVRNIASERDRADAALERVEATGNELAREHGELMLKHAQLLLTSDPSSAIDSLASYAGPDVARADQLRAEALGRGVARLRAIPHTDNILWARGMSDGSSFSLSLDGTISRTSSTGVSVVIAKDIASKGVLAYSAPLHLLAYSCGPGGLCLLDTTTGTQVPVPPELQRPQLASIAFSPDGSRLATLSATRKVRIFDIRNHEQLFERLHTSTGDGQAVIFIDDDAVAVGTPRGLKLVDLTGKTQGLSDLEGSHWDANPSAHRLAFSTTDGRGYVADINPLRIAARVDLCHGQVSGLKVLRSTGAVAFACKEGTVGTWNPQDGMIVPLAHLDGHANLIDASSTGDLLVVAGDNGVLAAIDLVTNLVTIYKGHGFRITALSPPTAEYPFILSADVHGGIRVWPIPHRYAKVAGNAHARVFSAMYNAQAEAVVAATRGPELTVLSSATGTQSGVPHTEDTGYLALAPDGHSFATYGASELVEIWTARTMSRTAVIDTHHGSVSHVAFAGNSEDIFTSDRDGRLVRWTPAGAQIGVIQLNQPIAAFVAIDSGSSLLVGTDDGALWRTDDQGRVFALKSSGSKVTRMLVLPDRRSVCVGYANGEVFIIETKTWRQALLLRASDAIRDIAVSGATIAVASNDETIHIGVSHDAAWASPATTWTSFGARARKIALTGDGLLVAACSDGALWAYSSVAGTWAYLPVGTADLTHVTIATDGKSGAVFDSDGRIIAIDLEAIHKALASSH
jgi:WD40 repeat protein